MDSSAIIGRSSENDITLPDLSVSRFHARIFPEESSWIIEDLGSANGIVIAGERVDKTELTPGDTFLLGEVQLRFMEAEALNAVEELFNTLETFATTIRYESAILQQSATKSRFERLQEALRTTPIFESLDDRDLEKVAATANLHLFSAGQSVIWEGDPSRSLYVVLEGRVEIFTKQFGGEKFQLAILESNDFFGEISLLTGEPRPMSAAAKEKSLLAEITYKHMQQLIKQYPHIKGVLYKYFQERVRDIRKKLKESGIKDPLRHPRLRERVPVAFTLMPKKTLQAATGALTYQASSLSISATAISILVKDANVEVLCANCRLKMEVELPSPWGRLQANGIIRRVVPEGQTAKIKIEFTGMSEKDSQKLKDFIRGEYHVGDRKVHPSEPEELAELLQQGVDKSWLSNYLRVFLPIAVVLFIGLVSLRLFFIDDTVPSRPPINLDPKDSLELLMSLQVALAKYSAAHEDKYPTTLSDLFPDPLADTGQNRRLLRYLVYYLDDRDGYRITIKEGSPLSGKDLIATANDVYSSKQGT